MGVGLRRSLRFNVRALVRALRDLLRVERNRAAADLEEAAEIMRRLEAEKELREVYAALVS